MSNKREHSLSQVQALDLWTSNNTFPTPFPKLEDEGTLWFDTNIQPLTNKVKTQVVFRPLIYEL
jgi:hypothetical protein